MKKEIGASAGVLALAAVLLHTQSNSGQEKSAGSSDIAQTHSRVQPAAGEERREGPWIATRAFFNTDEAPISRAEQAADGPCVGFDPQFTLSCLAVPGAPVDEDKLRSFLGAPAHSADTTWAVIASVADPSHTRLALFLDRQIEALQRSLQDSHWNFAGQWLPWGDRFEGTEGDINGRRRQRRLQRDQERLPGVLVFQRAASDDGDRDLLFVFLVPETPTLGIAGPPFYAAERLANALTRSPSRIGLLAPSFSGSFGSLTTLVQQWNLSQPDLEIKGAVYGGSISSREVANQFTAATNLSFHSGIAASSDNAGGLCAVLHKYGIPESQAAYVHEDQTVYGSSYHEQRQSSDRKKHRKNSKKEPAAQAEKPAQAAAADACQIPQYAFPRDISHLRDIYQDEPAAVAPGKKDQTGGVAFSLKDPSSGEDSVPAFSQAQTPLSQDAVIKTIVDDLSRRRTRLVYIVATNVLDTLFLARVIRRECPDTRVLNGNPDVLFVSAASQSSLTGTLFLSTYPMFFEGDEWTTNGTKGTERVVFPSPAFQGLYNVTQALLSGIGSQKADPAGDNFRGYRQLGNARRHPALWLLTLNRSGFMPIDQIEEFERGQKPPEERDRWFAHDPSAISVARPMPLFDTPPRNWFTAAAVITAFSVVASLILLGCNFSPSFRPPVCFALGHPFLTARLILITGAALALAELHWIVYLPIWLSDFEPGNWRPLMLAAGLVGALLPLGSVAAIWMNKRPRRPDARAIFYLLAPFFVFLVLTSAWAWSCTQSGSVAGFLFRFRALEIDSGSSPAVPFLVLGLAALFGCLFYFKRYTRAGWARPRLKLPVSPYFDNLNRCYRDLNQQLVWPVKAEPHAWRTQAVISSALFVACALGLWRFAFAIETLPYNYALVIGISIVMVCLVRTCYDLWVLWRKLGHVLELIDVFPLRTAFKRISRNWPRRPIWGSQRLSQPFVGTQMLIALQKRQRVLATAEAANDTARFSQVILMRFGARGNRTALVPEVRQLALPVSTGATAAQPSLAPVAKVEPYIQPGFLEQRRAYEKQCAIFARTIMERDLLTFWKDDIADGPYSTSNSPDVRPHCSEFVTLQISKYLIYVVRQIQAIAWCASMGLVMLMFLLNSYDPQAPILLGRFLALAFIIIAFVIFRVFAGMERNAILSRVSGTKPGELNHQFWIQLVGLGILPLLGALIHLFPSAASFVYSWVAPSVAALH
jgi:hypothetical protein